MSSAWRIAVLGQITSPVQLSIRLVEDTKGRIWHKPVVGSICIRTGIYGIVFSLFYTPNSQRQVFSWLLELEVVFEPSGLTFACGFIFYQFVICSMNPFIFLAFNMSSGNEFHKVIMHVTIKALSSVCLCVLNQLSHYFIGHTLLLVLWEAMNNHVLLTFSISFMFNGSLLSMTLL